MKLAEEIRNGNIIKIDRDLFLVVKCEYYRAARSNAIIKMKLKNLNTGSLKEVTYPINEKLDEVRLDNKKMQFLYEANGVYSFMDQETYDQVELSKEDLDDAVYFIKEEQIVDILFYEGKAVSVELPRTMDLKITYTEHVTRGDSSGKVLKPATLETGLVVQVPIFCDIDDVIKVDTTTKEYMERAK